MKARSNTLLRLETSSSPTAHGLHTSLEPFLEPLLHFLTIAILIVLSYVIGWHQ
jgi:hypothetical protein